MALRILVQLSRKPLQARFPCYAGSNHHNLTIKNFSISLRCASLQLPAAYHCTRTKTINRTQARELSTTSSAWNAKMIGQEYKEGRLIYIGSNGSRIKLFQISFYAVGAAALLASPFVLQKLVDHPYMQYIFATWLAMFGVGNPMFFYKFAKRYALEVYHDKENDIYTAFTISPFLFGSKKLVFSPQECRMPSAPTPFTTFVVKGNPLLVSSDDMSYTEYSKMLRFASEFDYENPDRQTQYRDAVQESIERISKPDIRESEPVTRDDTQHSENVSETKSETGKL